MRTDIGIGVLFVAYSIPGVRRRFVLVFQAPFGRLESSVGSSGRAVGKRTRINDTMPGGFGESQLVGSGIC